MKVDRHLDWPVPQIEIDAARSISNLQTTLSTFCANGIMDIMGVVVSTHQFHCMFLKRLSENTKQR